MRPREEKRRKLHEALLETLYPPSSPSSPSPSPVEFDEEPFDVTLINPDDYVNIDSSNHGDDDEEDGDDSETKPSRAQRKRIRKKMLKEEAARRRKVIGPLLPIEMIQTRNDSNGGEEASCVQPARLNAQEKEEKVSFEGNDKTKKIKKRREAKKLAKESSKPVHTQDHPTSETSSLV